MQAEQRGAAFLQHVVSLSSVPLGQRFQALQVVLQGRPICRDLVSPDNQPTQHPTTEHTEVHILTSACNMRTVVDLASALAPSVSVLGPCAVAERIADDQPLQQYMYQACEHQRSNGHAYTLPWWRRVAAAWRAAPPTPAVNTGLDITCLQSNTSETASNIWSQYTTQQAVVMHQVTKEAPPHMVWNISSASTTTTQWLQQQPSNTNILIYDGTLPDIPALESLLQTAYRPLITVRTPEAAASGVPVDAWVRVMQSYEYTCMMLAVDGTMMQATGCLSKALEGAAGSSDVVCVWRGLQGVLERWGG